jgi:hypothetical protein
MAFANPVMWPDARAQSTAISAIVILMTIVIFTPKMRGGAPLVKHGRPALLTTYFGSQFTRLHSASAFEHSIARISSGVKPRRPS